METFWEHFYDAIVIAIKVAIALIAFQVICILFDLDVHVPFISVALEWLFHILKIR